MKFRTLPGTDLRLSEVGFGVWTLATDWWGHHSDEEAISMLRLARDLGPRILGPGGQIVGEHAPMGGMLAELTQFAPAISIYGGSDEVQHNIIGERVLGLPSEPRNDRDLPFSQLRRSGSED